MTKRRLKLLTVVAAVLVAAGLAAWLSIAPPWAAKPGELKIGAILALTGGSAKYGEAMKRGVDLAVEEINAQGGVRGSKVNVVYEDSQGLPTPAVSAIRKLITAEKVPAIIGPMWSSPVLAAAPIANENKVVILSPGATAPAVTDAGDYVFRIVASDTYEATTIARFAYEELGCREIANLYINNDFGIGERESFNNRFEQLGGKEIFADTFEQDATDFRTQLTKLKEAAPQCLYLVGYKEMIKILTQMKELGVETQIVSFSMFEDPEIIEIVGDAAEGVYYSSQSFDPESPESVIKDFIAAYQKRYGEAPDFFAALGYDSAKALLLAIERGGVTSEGIKNALYGIRNFKGVTGEASFDENGDVLKSMSIKKVEDGEFVYVKAVYRP